MASRNDSASNLHAWSHSDIFQNKSLEAAVNEYGLKEQPKVLQAKLEKYSSLKPVITSNLAAAKTVR